jgi:FlaA1/EpsC-like NDP-sugar epimerase
MSNTTKFKQLILIFGDFLVLYLTLSWTLFLRYQALPDSDLWQSHLQIFTPVFIGWVIVFYIADFYNIHALKNSFEFNKKWGVVLGVNTLLAIAVFYFLPNEAGLTPKTNLLLFALNFGILGFVWRRLYNIFLRQGEAQNKILLIGAGTIAEKIFNHINLNPQLGYEIKFWMKEGLEDKEFDHLAQIIIKENVDLIAVPAHVKKIPKRRKKFIKIYYSELKLLIWLIFIVLFSKKCL